MQTSDQKPTDINSGYTEREWQKKFFAMGAKCYYCKSPLLFREATKDHRTPRCRGGSDNIRNIVAACLACNQKKGWKTESEFVKAVSPAFSTNPQARAGISLNLESAAGGEYRLLDLEMSLAQRDEPDIYTLRRESEGGCPIGFRSYPS